MDRDKIFALLMFIILLVAILTSCQTSDDKRSLFRKRYTEAQLKKLQNEAQEINKKSNVSARCLVDTYFELGDAYYYFEYYELAISAYKKGLRLQSWDCEYQLKIAILQFEKVNLNDSYRVLNFVIDNSKNEKYVRIAKKYLEHQRFEYMERAEIVLPEKKEYILILTQFGEVSPEIIKVVATRIAEEFKVSVQLWDDVLEPSEKNRRDQLDELFDAIIKSSRQALSDPEFEGVVSRLDIDDTDGFSADEKKRLAHYFITQENSGEKMWEFLVKQSKGRQYNAGALLDQLEMKFVAKFNDKFVLGVLAITASDIYAENVAFLFGYARKKLGVISYARFLDDEMITGATKKRIVIQSFSSFMFMLGLPRCTTPDCARAYAHSLSEHDKKRDYLCDECLGNLKSKYYILE